MQEHRSSDSNPTAGARSPSIALRWIFLFGVAAVAIINLCLFMLSGQAQQRQTRQAIEKSVAEQARLIAEAIRLPVGDANWAGVQTEFHRYDRFLSTKILRLVTTSGLILADSSSDLPGGSIAFGDLRPALAGMTAAAWLPDGHSLRVAVPVINAQQQVAAVLISESSFQAEFRQMRAAFGRQAAGLLLLNLAFIVLSTFIFFRYVQRPLEQIYVRIRTAPQGGRPAADPPPQVRELQLVNAALTQAIERLSTSRDRPAPQQPDRTHPADSPADDLRSQYDRLTVLLSHSEQFTRALSYEDALAAAGRGALEISQASGLAILVPGIEGRLSCAWSVNLPEEILTRLEDSSIRQEMQYALLQMAPIFIADTSILVNRMVLAQLASENHMRAVAVWPLRYEGEVSALACCFYPDVRRWSQSEKALLEPFLRQAGAALKNARIFSAIRQQADQIRRLNDITQAALQTEHIHQILPEIARQVTYMMNADGCYITLWDESRQVTIPVAAYGPNAAIYRDLAYNPDEVTLTKSALVAGRPLPVEDIYHTPYLSPQLAPTYPVKSLLTLPLIANGHKLGAVLVGFVEEHRFTREEIAISEQAAGQIALAFLKQHLLEVTQRRAHEAETLQEASIALTSSLELQDVLENILDNLEKVIQFDSACIFLIEPDQLRVGAVKNLDAPSNNRETVYPRTDALFMEIAASRLPVVLPDAQADPRFHRWGGTDHIHGWMGIPLIAGQELVGILTLDRREVNTFTPQDIKITQAFANHAAIAVQNARLYQDAQQYVRELEALHTATTSLVSTLDLQKLLEQILEAVMSAIVTAQAATLHLLDLETGQLQTRLSRGRSGAEALLEQMLTEQDYWSVLLEKQRPLLIHQSQTRDGLPHHEHCSAALVAPLIQEGETIGVLSLISSETETFTEADMRLVVSFASTAAAAIQNAQLHSAVQYLAITDPLTGVFNRRGFFEQANQVMRTAALYGRPVSAILIDIDYFKQVNDRYGHDAGDTVLQVLAERGRRILRESDIICRYGGEEFAFLLPESDLAGATQAAERLLGSISGVPVKTYSSEITVTISIGVASLCDSCETLEELLSCADHALYLAKESGRNQIRVWENGRAPAEKAL